MSGISADGSRLPGNPFTGFLVIILGGLLISSIFCVIGKSTSNTLPTPWHKTSETYICPKCGSIDATVQFHRKGQYCDCLVGSPASIDHLEVDCKRCGYSSYDPK